jgi:betaine-aldehyde dehydrogenase
VKRVSLELGGKNAMIVMPDADLDQVVDAAMRGMSLEISLGQSCQATSRVFVHERLYDEFVSRAALRMTSYRIGPACEERTQLGPMISSRRGSTLR